MGTRKKPPGDPDRNWKRIPERLATLAPHAFTVVSTVASANYTAAQGANGVLTYAFSGLGLLTYVYLSTKAGR